MKTITFYLTLLLLSITLYSQESALTGEKKKENLPKYDINFNMKELVYHKYRFTENTKVKRIMEDSTMSEYEKNVTYYFNIFVPGPKDENGFLLVEISTDSMDYDYVSGNHKVEYFTQDYETMMPINFIDYLETYLPNGKSFNFLYSTYGDVAEISGERLESEREEYNQIKDSLKRTLIVNSVSNEKLKFICNITKNIYPPFKVENDTTWNNDINFFVCSTPLTGEVTHKFDGYSDKEYHISTKLDSLSLKNQINIHYFPDLDTYGSINSGVSTGEMKSDLFTNGTVKYMRANLKTLLNGSVGQYKFKQFVESTFTWDLLGRFAYK